MYSLVMVDDEIWTLRDMQGLLENIDGFEIAGLYTNPLEAEKAILENPPDLVLTDLKMEELSGQKLMRTISDHCPNTLIIICSAYRDFDAARDAIKYNVIDYILKPILEEDFRRAFRMAYEALKKRHVDASAYAYQRAVASYEKWTHSLIERIKKEAPCACHIEQADDAYAFIYYDHADSMETWIRSAPENLGFSREQTKGTPDENQKKEALCALLARFAYTDYDPLNKVQSYIALHYDEKLTLNQLAEEIGFASAYLCDLFRKKCGIQLFAFIKHVRISIACHLLKTTALPVRTISDKVGYEDNSHFCREFKAMTGFTPTVYRQEHAYPVSEKQEF
ncbi:MAG: response regulator [Clostridia bacterium]|nr:response regulator [Clostridia bacterium]